MVILLPEIDQFERFERLSDAEAIDTITEDLAQREVSLTMPKFEFESSFSLVDALAAMGMPAAFSGGADFSGMTGTRELFIGELVHKTFVSVDQAGTEAAAATTVVMKEMAMPEQPVEVMIDHPFLFLIRDIETGAGLFIGRVTNSQ